MSAARDAIFHGIRQALWRGRLSPDRAGELAERVAAHRRNLVPARAATLGHRGRVELFVAMAEAVQTTVARVDSVADIPAEVARYLAAENLPAELVAAPDPSLDAIPWETRPLLQIRRGRAEAQDAVSLTPCLAGIAETGTLMLASGPGTPSTLNFLPDTHIVVLHTGQVVASYEDGWDLLRALRHDDPPPLAGEVDRPAGGPEGADASRLLPRTVNLITGPSRTGDIEQRIQLGAHGPRRLHVVLVEDAPSPR
ncbi:MAG: lactate utilization protein [Alphaproteobacteria bacterium]|nr:lactate utilization protein [Alphaproteobacteria bacterium]